MPSRTRGAARFLLAFLPALLAALAVDHGTVACARTAGRASGANGTSKGGKPHKGGKPARTPVEKLLVPCPNDDAKCHLESGIRLFKAAYYEEARAELEQAYGMLKAPGALRLIAECYRQTQRFVEAYAAYERVLDDHEAQLSPKDKGDIKLVLDVLERITAQLEMHVDEVGAEIFIDGHSAGRTPLRRPVRVTVGPHRVRATLEGSQAIEQEVDVKAQQKLAVTMRFVPDLAQARVDMKETKVATFAMHVVPPEGVILFDGKEMATGSFEGEVPFGKHRVEVVLPGYRSFLEDVTFETGKITRKDVILVRAGPAAREEEEERARRAAGNAEGLYGGVLLFGTPNIVGQTVVPCPPAATCQRQLDMGGGLHVRGGYAWGPLGVEGGASFFGEGWNELNTIQGTLDVSDPTFSQGNVQRNEAFARSSVGGFAGVGGRLSTGGDLVKFTAAVLPGVSVRRYALHRSVTGGVVDSYQTSATTGAFAVQAEAGVTIGATPGFRFLAGLFLWTDFPSAATSPSGDPRTVIVQGPNGPVNVALSTPPYVLAKGPQIYLGPTLGFLFGN